MARPEYTIHGGRVDAERLARQAAVMARATMAFLTRVGLRPGWACLDVGPRLPALLAAVGLEGVSEDTVANRMTTVDQKLFLVELVDNLRDVILAGKVATASELDALRTAAEAAARDPGTVFHQARIHQVHGYRRD